MGVLENKENIWNSSHLWKIVPKGNLVRIEKIYFYEEKPDDSSYWSENSNDEEGSGNVEKITFLRNPISYGSVVFETDFEEDVEYAYDGWKKGQTNEDGYFTLEDPKSSKVLTAISKDGLEIKGNI